MPYITQTRRRELAEGALPSSEGELNYTITTQVKEYVRRMGLSYATINEVVGALESAKLEFYRRVAVPYEDQKRHDNGDVYDI